MTADPQPCDAPGGAAGAIHAVVMPKWGLAMSEGLVAGWHLEEGAAVERGADLVDIETEKITNVLEAPGAGVLRRRLVAEGEIAPVGALLAVIAAREVGEEAIERFVAAFAERAAAAGEAEEAAPEPAFVEVGGRRFRYLAMGSGGETPLVLVHGFGGDLNSWLFNQPVLAASRPVIAVDLPGHGASTKELRGAGIAALAADLGAVLDALDLAAVHLAGHSLGGALALTLALETPARVRSLTLVASAGLGPGIDGEYLAGFIAARRRKELRPWVERLFADPALVGREMLDEILRYKRIDGVPELLERIAAALFPGGRQALELRGRLAGLACRCQVLWGAADRILPPEHAEGLPAAIPVHLLEGAGHMVHMERAAEVNALIEAFVEGGG